jgi:putative endonuclease
MGLQNPSRRVRVPHPLPRSVYMNVACHNRLHGRDLPQSSSLCSWMWLATNYTTPHEFNSMFYFYILRSRKNGKLYLGYTTDLKTRLRSHNLGQNDATKPNIPYELIFYSGFINQIDAIHCERYYKTTAGWRRIKTMLENTILAIPKQKTPLHK